MRWRWPASASRVVQPGTYHERLRLSSDVTLVAKDGRGTVVVDAENGVAGSDLDMVLRRATSAASSSPASPPAVLCRPPCGKAPTWTSASPSWPTAVSTPTPRCTECSPRRRYPGRRMSSRSTNGSRRAENDGRTRRDILHNRPVAAGCACRGCFHAQLSCGYQAPRAAPGVRIVGRLGADYFLTRLDPVRTAPARPTPPTRLPSPTQTHRGWVIFKPEPSRPTGVSFEAGDRHGSDVNS
jgi:hypothetical protein